jgi:hypothetical protein
MHVARPRLSGRPGKRGNASRPSGLSCGRGSIARQGVLARPPSSEQGNSALPGNGQVSLQKSFGGVLVQRSVVHTTQQSWCHGVTGDLAREAEAAWRHVARSRGERLFLQGERPRKGTIAFGKRACEEASFASGHGGKVVGSTRGRAAPPVSETRPGGGALGYRTREGTSDRESGLRFTRRRWQRSRRPSTGRDCAPSATTRIEGSDRGVRGSVVVRCGTSNRSAQEGEDNSPRILWTARRSASDVVKTSGAPCDVTRTGTDEARVLVVEESGSSRRSETSRPSSRPSKGDDGGLAGRKSFAQLTRQTTAIGRNGVRRGVCDL